MRKYSNLIMVILTILNLLVRRSFSVRGNRIFALLITVCLILNLDLIGQVAVNTSGADANSSAMLDVSSTGKGILIPRMTKSERDAISVSSAQNGLLIYQTDNTSGFYFYNSTTWVVVGDGATTINSLYDGVSDGSSVFLGNGSGANDDETSNQNLGYGINALNANTSGYENTAIGNDALKLVDEGHHNTALGIHSLSSITTGSSNTALGTNAGISNTGSGNIFIGANAAYNEMGSNKLYIHNSSSATPLIYGDFDNTFLRINGTFDINNAYRFPTVAGTNGQLLKTDGSGNLSWADDTNTGATNIDGLSDGLSDGNSLYMGAEAGNLAGSNKFSTGVGVWSLKNVTTGSNNTALGTSSLMGITEGSNNTVIGTNALQTITTTSNNTAIGREAGQSVTGSGNIFIGNEAAKTQTSISNKLFIDNSDTVAPLIYGDFSTNLLRINGTLDINNSYRFPTVAGTTGQLLKTDGSGNLSWADDTNTGATSINGLSDAKTDGSSVFLGNYAGDDDDGNNYATAIGVGAMSDNTNGYKNTAVGSYSLDFNTIGGSNTALGAETLKNNTTASDNTAVGCGALKSNTTGHHNTSTGSYALDANIDGCDNTAFGAYALWSNTTASDNTAVGREALKSNTTGHHNTSLGRSALDANTEGTDNTAIGADALGSSITASYNTAVGREALKSNTTGNKNTAVGLNSLNLNTVGVSNTAVGVDALKNNTSASDNTSIGMESLLNNINGHHNTALGRSSLGSCTEGNYNTAIGADAGPSGSWALSNTGTFGYDAHATASNYYRFGNGNVESIGGKVGWSAWSDKRFKKNINANVPGLDFILKLQPVSYNWDIQKLNAFIGSAKSNEQSTEEQKKVESIVYTGFLAQDVEEAANEIGYDFSGVETPPNDGTPYSLRYAEFVVPLVKAVQEQQEMIEKQTIENEEMKSIIAELIKRIEVLERK